ncbi:MAG: hypothetical protein IKF99_20235 [Oscillospiraceae bacterium]|nr:hypothetical protein [Oscillospiraceae bacterium]
MKNNRIHTILIALALSMTMLVGCGRSGSAEVSTAPTAAPVPTGAAEPAASPEAAIADEQQPAAPQEAPVPAAQTAAPVSAPPAPAVTPDTQVTVQPAPAASSAPVQTPAANQGAAGERFTGVMGSEFLVPEGFIQLDESPNIGYQYTFWHPEHEIRIVVYEIAPGYIPEGAYETDYQIAKSNPDVTYFNEGKNWFVQSGYNNNGEEIFYSKESTTDSGLKTFWISYPTAKREYGDAVTAAFEADFSF